MIKARINQAIRANELRVINEDGTQLGIFSLPEALAKAEEEGLDLVEIVPGAKPPVAKLINYDKYRYQQKKLEQSQRKNAKRIEIKTIRLSVRIGDHDLEVKAKQADKFLQDGDLVRVELRMRGREQAYGQLGEQQVKNFQTKLTSPNRVETPMRRLGPTISLTLAPTK